MIRIFLGNVGSGKTVCAVRDMYKSAGHRTTYSNIITKLKNQKTIDPKMIIKSEIVDHKKKKDGTTEPVYKHSLNQEYWKKIIEKEEAINVTIDEAHSILNARRSMSKINIIISDWLALIRRVLGASEAGHGELTFISQLHNRIDVIAREMATQIRYFVCHYQKTCKQCGFAWAEHSELPEPQFQCKNCSSFKITKHNHVIEAWHFSNMANYEAWKMYSAKTYYKHYVINDIENYFPLYNTLQWDNMFSSLY